MYHPWMFAHDMRTAESAPPLPQLAWSVRDRSVVVHWTGASGPVQQFDITFEDGLAGLVAVDESTYATTCGCGLPRPEQFDASGFPPLPWPAWKEENSPRAEVYGDLGRLHYTRIDSYYLSGANFVLLLDVADCVPRIARVRRHKCASQCVDGRMSESRSSGAIGSQSAAAVGRFGCEVLRALFGCSLICKMISGVQSGSGVRLPNSCLRSTQASPLLRRAAAQPNNARRSDQERASPPPQSAGALAGVVRTLPRAQFEHSRR